MIRFRRLYKSPIALLAGALLAAPAAAQIETRVSRIEASQEVPPTSSPARGIGVYVIDATTNTLSWLIAFEGLTSAESAAHIHGFAPVGTNAGIQIGLALGSPKCGTAGVSSADVPSYDAGLAYVNIHTSAFPNGEIRGQIAEAPSHQNLCPGDGTAVTCPCANDSIAGYDEGCLNSLGTGARLRGYGPAQLGADQLVLHVSRTTSGSQLLFQGTSSLAPGTVFGDGLRCVGGNVLRLGIGMPCNGQFFWPAPGQSPISLLGAVDTAGARFYQVWYRNPAAYCSAATYNFSNAVQVNWQ